MQKSAHPTAKAPRHHVRQDREPMIDKGQKFEPFWNAAFGSDRRSHERQMKADQKR